MAGQRAPPSFFHRNPWKRPVPYKPTIAIDFDGVIHSYEAGWQDGEIYGEVVPGFWEWAKEAEPIFNLVVHSARSGSLGGNEAMSKWLQSKFPPELAPMPRLEFSYDKPKAMLYINDRALTFNGDWYDRDLSPSALREFKPWNQQ